MIEDLTLQTIDDTIYRLANPPRLSAALADLGAELPDIAETIEFLSGVADDDITVLLDAPFAEKPAGSYIKKATRFSDGSWKVFYGALERETCVAEVGSWCLRNMQSAPPAPRRFYYREFRCRVNTSGFDVRPKKAEWPYLTGDVSSYAECHALAREARTVGAQALLCPSARYDTGTTTPVFARVALSGGDLLDVVCIQLNDDGTLHTERPSGR